MKMVKMDMITRKGDIAFVISSDWKGKEVLSNCNKRVNSILLIQKYKINFIDYI
jgi:hypothetical protein